MMIHELSGEVKIVKDMFGRMKITYTPASQDK